MLSASTFINAIETFENSLQMFCCYAFAKVFNSYLNKFFSNSKLNANTNAF